MEQKSDETASGRRRGRPREYDSDQALNRAADLFWRNGYAAVSLDDIARATGMNRPSLAAAFGDKRNLYLRTLERYRDASRAQAVELLSISKSLRAFLRRFYAAAIDIYLAGEDVALGCYSIGTAATQAATDPEVRRFLSDSIRGTDAFLADLFRSATKGGELPSNANPMGRARVGTATLHTLAIRARAGASRGDLRDIANAAVELLCT
jgi:AcrR family transcriptional regulator